MVKEMTKRHPLLVFATLAALAAWPGQALATPELATNSGQPLTSLAQATFPYVVAGGKWEIPLLVRDSEHCGHDQVNPADKLVGTTVEVLLAGPDGQFAPFRSVVLDRSMIEDRCAADGYVIANPDLIFIAPQNSQQFKVRLLDIDGGQLATSDSADLYTSFWQKFSFRPAASPKGLPKGKITATLIGDRRLVGMRATFFWRERGSSLYRPLARKTIALRNQRAELRFTKRSSRSGGRVYICLDYATLYPKMWTGNRCPSKAITPATLEKLFPLSTATR